MPSVTYNGQSFAIDGRRIWILAASIQYARIPAGLWVSRIAAAKQAGFNTIETACPWVIHEPRDGRFNFQGDADIRKFVQTCAAAGMRVILRAGPFIGSQFDAGGLPGWLVETPDIKLRQNNEIFLEHVARYFRKLLGEVSDLQTSSPGTGASGGPIILMQSEHEWTCSNEVQAEKYLHEITRYIRESGITVPIINSNDLWQESRGTIDTWSGYDDLMVHVRQLRSVQTNAPRLVSAFEAAHPSVWGEDQRSAGNEKSPDAVLRRLAEILASGAQPVVSPFHAGTNFGFLGGRLAGGPDRFCTTSAATDPPLGEDGTRGRKYHALRRLTTFATNFGHVFADLDPEYQPVVLDPQGVIDEHSSRPKAHSPKSTSAAASDPVSVIGLRGTQGQIVFAFSGKSGAATTLVLEDGIRLPINLGDQPVGWFALNVDLLGAGRLDYASICPWAIIDRSIVVFQGPAKTPVILSINNTPVDAVVPAEGAASKPLVLEHKDLTVVICNQSQIDATYHDDAAVYVGVSGLDDKGKPIASADFPKGWVIRRGAKIAELRFEEATATVKHPRRAAGGGAAIKLDQWEASPCMPHVSGESPRFASLEGPQTLSRCGSPSGYGWYRIELKSSGKRLCHLPESGDRLHIFLHGRRRHLLGVGPGAQSGPVEMKFENGEQTMVALVDNLGRFSEGNDLAHPKGIWGHVQEVRLLRSAKPKGIEAEPVDPFTLRGFISGQGEGQMSDARQAAWSFEHTKKNPILVDVNGAQCTGTFVLNDEPIAYYAGRTGACRDRIMLDPKKLEAFKRGRNVLRFAPDARQDKAVEDISRHTELYECVEAISESGAWAFAKWEAPNVASYSSVEKSAMKALKGAPCWWRTAFAVEPSAKASLWLEVNGLSKGQVLINGQNLGRYFTSGPDGRLVGPQSRLYVPAVWLKTDGSPNELVIFDEHGFDPSKVKLSRGQD